MHYFICYSVQISKLTFPNRTSGNGFPIYSFYNIYHTVSFIYIYREQLFCSTKYNNFILNLYMLGLDDRKIQFPL